MSTDLASRVAAARKARGWSQGHLANLAGVHKNTVLHIEKSGSANSDTLAAIALVLGITIEIGGDPVGPVSLRRVP